VDKLEFQTSGYLVFRKHFPAARLFPSDWNKILSHCSFNLGFGLSFVKQNTQFSVDAFVKYLINEIKLDNRILLPGMWQKSARLHTCRVSYFTTSKCLRFWAIIWSRQGNLLLRQKSRLNNLNIKKPNQGESEKFEQIIKLSCLHIVSYFTSSICLHCCEIARAGKYCKFILR